MKRKGIGTVLVLALVLSLCLIIAAPAAAVVDTTEPSVVEVDASGGLDLTLHAYESNTEIRVFNEQQCVYVENLATADGPITGWVDSHLIHQDTVENDDITMEGSVTFDNEIISIITSDAGLDASDSILGLGAVTYPNGQNARGLEGEDAYLIDGKTVTIHLRSTTALDQARVLTIAKIAVDIDIKPGSDKNPINNNGHGVIPVAILGSEDFDVTQIDPSTIELEGMVIKRTGKTEKLLAHIEDVNEDGFDDLVVQIQDMEGALMVGATEATLTGNLHEEFGGTPIEGTDTICLVPDKA